MIFVIIAQALWLVAEVEEVFVVAVWDFGVRRSVHLFFQNR